ncbi:sensor histidine kinase [Parasulfitobacter algicola]|uniref:histidine kinase n=1 Tax=Parasulfitobacter algicola TaxID=2614809 RepID=A0ABX2IYU0_9RHOB|nr:ATP-binding protein [Sulfitobacter algicola]NSX55821.1 sensor histidine kinase [Sulfitobacter algicola]
MVIQVDQDQGDGDRTFSWRIRIALGVLVTLAVITVWMTNVLLTERFTENTRNRADVRLALYTGNLIAELEKNAIMPGFLSTDPSLISALNSKNYRHTSQRLLERVENTGAASAMLLDLDGRVVASTDRGQLGSSFRTEPFFLDALRANDTIFKAESREIGGFRFTHSLRIEQRGAVIGVIVVEADLQKFERSWAGITDAVMVTNSSGQIVLSTEPRWRGLQVDEALDRQTPPSAIARAIQATTDWPSADTFIAGEPVMRMQSRVPFQGWQITTFTSYNSVRERVNGVLALEIMGFAILLALTFYAVSRKSATLARVFQMETAQLRRLNDRLQREVAERERVEKSLDAAEQTLAQSSKLAALGEMSAAVSHELNQPLAAMKTYLAGASLLLQRKRPDEALSSFQRIDDLIERMGAITKQLKSYARKGGDAFEPVDTRFAVSSALSMMEPQLKTRSVKITKAMPSDPVMVMADRLRLEQVIINLLRNALDATKGEDDPTIDILLSAGDTVVLSVRDNGSGIEDLESLFEPFYTTKQPGDGVGLGLAISSGIINDLGGRLTAKNAATKGAVFEIQLPILTEDIAAAE